MKKLIISRNIIRSAVLAVSLLTLLSFAGSTLASELVDINFADVDTISAALEGIGPTKAKAIIDYRESHGVFQNIEELSNVPGIGESTLNRIRDFVTVGSM